MAPRRWWHRLTAGSVRANLVIVDLQSRRADEAAKAAEPVDAVATAEGKSAEEDGEETATGNVTDQDVATFIDKYKQPGLWASMVGSNVVSALEGLHQAVVEQKQLKVARADREAAVSALAAMQADTQVIQRGDDANIDARQRAEAKLAGANANLDKAEAAWANLKRKRDAEYHRVKQQLAPTTKK